MRRCGYSCITIIRIQIWKNLIPCDIIDSFSLHPWGEIKRTILATVLPIPADCDRHVVISVKNFNLFCNSLHKNLFIVLNTEINVFKNTNRDGLPKVIVMRNLFGLFCYHLFITCQLSLCSFCNYVF